MSDFFTDVLRLLLRLVLVAVGVVFFLSLLAAALVLALVWGLRALWARLTGRPVTPWATRIDPRAGWSSVYRSSTGSTGAVACASAALAWGRRSDRCAAARTRRKVMRWSALCPMG